MSPGADLPPPPKLVWGFENKNRRVMGGGLLYFRTPVSVKSKGEPGAMSGRQTVTCSLLSMGKDSLTLALSTQGIPHTMQSVLRPGLCPVRSIRSLSER